ncbi:unnamed protein product [Meloidogyne enterolobii]|uniref:Uncharacterized protein n=1 Tax=Meloidogyne enterolobii TaxID=390850 RepID=A0ACB0ZT77_MELEN
MRKDRKEDLYERKRKYLRFISWSETLPPEAGTWIAAGFTWTSLGGPK